MKLKYKFVMKDASGSFTYCIVKYSRQSGAFCLFNDTSKLRKLRSRIEQQGD
jgi:hypothetical protein